MLSIQLQETEEDWNGTNAIRQGSLKLKETMNLRDNCEETQPDNVTFHALIPKLSDKEALRITISSR